MYNSDRIEKDLIVVFFNMIFFSALALLGSSLYQLSFTNYYFYFYFFPVPCDTNYIDCSDVWGDKISFFIV